MHRIWRLDEGVTYTFVAVSLGSANAIPPTIPDEISARNLNNAHITISTTGTSVLMYDKEVMTVSGNGINRVNLLLRHLKPFINVRINAAQTGQNITAVEGAFRPHNNGMTGTLSDESHSQSGVASSALVTHGTNGVFIATSHLQKITTVALLLHFTGNNLK